MKVSTLETELKFKVNVKTCSALQVIANLLSVLPDSYYIDHEDDITWDWAWNNLSDEAQQKVKQIRREAVRFIVDKVEVNQVGTENSTLLAERYQKHCNKSDMSVIENIENDE